MNNYFCLNNEWCVMLDVFARPASPFVSKSNANVSLFQGGVAISTKPADSNTSIDIMELLRS